MPVGKGGRKHHSPKRQAALGRAQGKNIAKTTELSLPGEQRVPPPRWAGAAGGFPQQSRERCEQRSTSYRCLGRRRKATPRLQLTQNSFAVPLRQETPSLRLPLGVPPRRCPAPPPGAWVAGTAVPGHATRDSRGRGAGAYPHPFV